MTEHKVQLVDDRQIKCQSISGLKKKTETQKKPKTSIV